MAESADGRTAGTFITDLVPKRKEGEEENMYNQEHSMDMLVFPFGKGVTTKLGKYLVHKYFEIICISLLHRSCVLRTVF